MTTTGDITAAHTRSRPVTVLIVATLASLVLSPITAVWALLVGQTMLFAGLAVSRMRPRGRSKLVVLAGLGMILGVLPYFLLAAIQA